MDNVAGDMDLRSWCLPGITGKQNALLKSPIRSGSVEDLWRAHLMLSSVAETLRLKTRERGFDCGTSASGTSFVRLLLIGLMCSAGGSGLLKGRKSSVLKRQERTLLLFGVVSSFKDTERLNDLDAITYGGETSVFSCTACVATGQFSNVPKSAGSCAFSSIGSNSANSKNSSSIESMEEKDCGIFDREAPGERVNRKNLLPSLGQLAPYPESCEFGS